MADSKNKKKKTNNVNSNLKSANKKRNSKKKNTTKKNIKVETKKGTAKKNTKKSTNKKNVKEETKNVKAKKSTPKKSSTKKNVKVETKKVTAKKNTKKNTTKKNVKVETKNVKTKKSTKKIDKSPQISTTSVKVSPEQMEALTSIVDDNKKVVRYKTVRGRKKVKVNSNLEPIKKVANSSKAKTKFVKTEEEKSKRNIDEAFKESEKDEIIAREVSALEKPVILESYDIDNLKDSKATVVLFRLAFCVIILIFSIWSIVIFTEKLLTNSGGMDISYYESSDVSYNLCSNDNCSGELLETSDTMDKANVTFKYDAHFDDKANYNVVYSINYKFEIFDDTKTYYSNKTQVSSKMIKDKKDSLVIDTNSDINLAEYRDKLKKYNEEHKSNYNGSVTAILKVIGVGEDKEVASLYVPLGNGRVDTTIISSNMGDATFTTGTKTRWSGIYICLIIVCFIVVVLASVGIVLLYFNYDPIEDE